MAIYAIGDVQGCYDQLRRLLDKLDFEAKRDELWFVGDLVNRGPKSLETLRFIKSLGDSAVTVLGNHDLHLIATFLNQRKTRRKDTLSQVLEASDCEELIDWLRKRPIFHHNKDFCMLHAGLPPQWGFDTTQKMAAKVEKIFRGSDYGYFFKTMYGDKPDIWSKDLANMEKARFIVNCFTRMRYCDRHGRLDFHQKGEPGSQHPHLMPWYAVPGRKSINMKIVFGHWSTLGFFHGYNCYAIDTGCLWGGELTALKLGNHPKKISIQSDL